MTKTLMRVLLLVLLNVSLIIGGKTSFGAVSFKYLRLYTFLISDKPR